ncbi:MAG: arylsulfatase [Verrucomicrobiae bacterium]|nr:arylsulfatase [Verrucomicrobiae bacterium]
MQQRSKRTLFNLLLPLIGALTLGAAGRPNVVVIMVDDLGYSDIGCYGGEIDTPNLDALAADGMRFSQFYNTAKCHSSRVSLLTGQYCIAAGDTALSHGVTSAETLGAAGYFTAMTGKWHLKKQPTDFGFERYFGHLSGACNYFSGDNTFRLNGEPWTVPANDFYTTVANVDHALDFLGEARRSKKPWYLYVAFNAPHAPLHALPEDYAKYKGRYESGWDEIREARVVKQKELGLLPAELRASPRPEHVPAWSGMARWKRDYEANRMTTLAAMIDRVDQEVGRLVSDLKKNGELENTLILFVSDNGACPYDRRAPLLDVEPTNAKTALADSTGWAWARNSPFRYYKQNQFEGGISSPAIVHWPAGLKVAKGGVVHQPAHLIDVLPTLADITGSKIPSEWPGRDLRPVSGVSLKPLFDGGKLGPRPPIHLLFSQDRGLRDGDWKLVSFQSEAWELYNVAEDRTELNDLAASEPERLRKMIAMWNDMTKNVLHAPAKVAAPVTPAALPHRHREWTNFEGDTPAEYVRKKVKAGREGSAKTPARAIGRNLIRARKNTALKIVGSELHLKFTGDDPGLAMDLRGNDIPNGPYSLAFRLLSGAKVGGEILYTIDPKLTLPKGTSVKFPVEAGDEWREMRVELATDKQIRQVRLDIGDGPGEARIDGLRLLNATGETLLSWPAK